ncbi:MAG: ABC transporter ATP-binding protein [Candidatus Syntrophonatronum acetioxidans]|uniref:ABC transporter ATP-binding protein n=1 Tax=Candidatus Syntrophonatronum acetioxidans TaxID=1795816 RepID=A0A424YB90_9FIRM|nr:MAG: ABC transporter ATP-binding protein [Candidatus Syntrophonatronum acetioxidans]
MAVLNIKNLGKSYGENTIFEGVSLQVFRSNKMALVGPNGAGKTTLLRILMGEEEADEGSISFSRGVSVGYLKQKEYFPPGTTFFQQLKKPLTQIYALGEELKKLEKEMASEEIKENPRLLEKIMEEYGRLSQSYQEKGGYFLDKRIKQVAGGLGFSEEDLERQVDSFSGGEKTCLQLACLLLEEHDLILLDEPTNYLDIKGVEWLEEFLAKEEAALLVASHDRYFLNRVVDGVAHLDNKTLKTYKGNYSQFMEQYHLQKVSQEKAHQKQEELIKKEEDLIRTSKGGERDKRQAKSREKKLEGIERVEAPGQEGTMSLDFNYAGRAGQEVLVFEEAGKEYQGRELFKDISFTIKWGDRVALVGPNGAGKSTLMKMITGEVEPSWGIVRLGPSVKIAYFDQEQGQLNPQKRVLEEITDFSGLTISQARNYLGRYLFKGDDVFKRVGSLSGGERSRLVLAKVALPQANFLLLDEPTNHLDIKGLEELESSLSRYPGTLLFVSHDRYFISSLASKIMEVDKGRVILYQGDYHYYKDIKEKEKDEKDLSRENRKAYRQKQKEQERFHREEMLAKKRDIKRIENRLKEMEERIEELEGRRASYEEKLSNPQVYEDFEEVRRLNQEYKETKKELEGLYVQWEDLGLEYDKRKEDLEKELNASGKN